jgi:predicted O-methyltransferase YrrM
MKTPINLVDVDGIKKLTMTNDLSSHLSTHAYLYLQPNGWFNDYPCDEEGITPWYTFPAIAFLKDIIHNDMRVLEYGSGYSTLYFKSKVKQLVTIEHSKEWADKLLSENNALDIHVIEQNTKVHIAATEIYNNFTKTFPQIRSNDYDHDLRHGLVNFEFGGYTSRIYQAPTNYYDMVVIDGMARALCTVMTIESNRLKDDGIIILDNSDRWQYNPLQQYLADNKFGRIDFWGPGWNNYHAWCTSFYSRKFPINNNRLFRPETEGQIFT